MGQIIGNALSSGNYRTMASVARSQGRAQQAAYNLKANNLEEEARADSRLAALNMSRMRENQASNQASARVRQASSGFAAEGSSMQNELALADVFEKSIADMALSNALSDSGKRTAAMASRQQGRLSMMQADAQAGQYNRLAKSARNAAWIQGASTLLSAAAGGSLDHDRKTNLFCHDKSIFCCVYRLFASRNNRNSGLHHGISGF